MRSSASVAACHTRSDLSCDPEMMRVPSEAKTRLDTAPACPPAWQPGNGLHLDFCVALGGGHLQPAALWCPTTFLLCPEFASHVRRVLSADPDAMMLCASDANATHSTAAECPTHLNLAVPVSTSHTEMVPSSHPQARSWESEENVRHRTALLCVSDSSTCTDNAHGLVRRDDFRGAQEGMRAWAGRTSWVVASKSLADPSADALAATEPSCPATVPGANARASTSASWTCTGEGRGVSD